MDIFKELKLNIKEIISRLAKKQHITINNELFNNLVIKLSPKQQHGEIYTNATLILAKILSYPINEIGQLLINELIHMHYIEKATMSSPGFINIIIKKSIWAQTLDHIISKKIQFGNAHINKNTILKCTTTFSTYPPYISLRGVVFMNALASILIECGYKTTKQYYITYTKTYILALIHAVKYYISLLVINQPITKNTHNIFLIKIGQQIIDDSGGDVSPLSEIDLFLYIKHYILNNIHNNVLEQLYSLNIHCPIKLCEIAEPYTKSHSGDIPNLDNILKYVNKKHHHIPDTITITCKNNTNCLHTLYVSNQIVSNNTENNIHIPPDDMILIFLSQKYNMPLYINFNQIFDKSRNNVIFYIKYTYNLVCYILHHTKNSTPHSHINLSKLDICYSHYSKEEICLIHLLSLWPQLLEEVSISYDVHRIVLYLQKLSIYFYNIQYKDNNKNLPFIYNNDINLTVTKLALIRALKVIIESGLSIIGINVVATI
ncbi:arginyl-tRNA synthetase [Rickettsiales bacterium Ac37b]|nr:arginyl-tRNA synthetase [Rickettsiales bacterium Ac37b]